MIERKTTLFGSAISYLQERYIAQRIRYGCSYEESYSEPVLKHLRNDGLSGIPGAWKEIKLQTESIVANDPEYILHPKSPMFSLTCLSIAVVGTVQFLSAATGIGMPKLEEDNIIDRR